jgi:hypothetical protein
MHAKRPTTGVAHALKRPKAEEPARIGNIAKESSVLRRFTQREAHYFTSQHLSTKTLTLLLLRNGEVLRAPRARRHRTVSTEPLRRLARARASLGRGLVLT